MNESFEFRRDGSAKFWTVQLKAKRVITTWGRIGSTGRTTEKEFASAAAARDEAEKMRDQKIRKGYERVSQKTAAKKTPAKKTPAKKTPAKKTPAKKTPAKKTPAKKTPAKKTPARKTPARKTPAKKTPAKKSPAVNKSVPNLERVPQAAREAFSSDSSLPLKLTRSDLTHFKGLIKGDNINHPALSARHLRLVRLLEIVPNVPYGSSSKDELIACIDLSQLPKGWSKSTGDRGPKIILHMSHMIQALVGAMGVKILTYTAGGGFTGMVLGSGTTKLRPLLALHQEYIGAGPLFLEEPDAAWEPWVKLTNANIRKTRRLSKKK